MLVIATGIPFMGGTVWARLAPFGRMSETVFGGDQCVATVQTTHTAVGTRTTSASSRQAIAGLRTGDGDGRSVRCPHTAPSCSWQRIRASPWSIPGWYMAASSGLDHFAELVGSLAPGGLRNLRFLDNFPRKNPGSGYTSPCHHLAGNMSCLARVPVLSSPSISLSSANSYASCASGPA